MTDILMPALSPTMEEGTLTKWHVKVGDTVSSGDVIAEIETDKATMEVEAVDEGVVSELLVPEGTEGVKVNAPIARLKGDGVTAAPAPAAAPTEAAKPAEPEPKAPEPAPQAAPAAQAAPAPAPTTNGSTAPPATPAPAPAVAAPKTEGQRIFASPLARRMAAQAGVDLKAIQGSGPHGRIIKRDVEGKSGQAPAAGAAAPAPAAAAPQAAAAEPRQVLSLEHQGIPPGSYDLIPLDNIRKVSARRLTEAFREIPHFPLTVDCEIDRLLEARAAINAVLEKDGVKVSVNDIVIKAAALALKRVPEANASYTAEGIAMHHSADISMAVAIPGGLITPIIFKAETKSLSQIARETKDLAARARERKLKPQEFMGGTFSVSNLGMFGIKDFASIVNEPQGAIMSVGAGEKRPVVHGDQLAVATVMSVTVTCDHRVVDGATGARFLQAFKALIEEPVAMLA
jgi:pyruvate dehydrogenase E2 component (dihydrolipoyllysine-residue acetyltransferase)